jgi:alkylation response protein AidB-like acyl-CoA dehydrogenase
MRERDLDTYRSAARQWIESNLERARRNAAAERGGESAEAVAAFRASQKRLYEAGWAGIDIPIEYGGQGLSPAHAAVFAEEARDYLLPDLGVLTLVTFGIVLPSILATCTETFKQRHIPRILAGEELWCQLLSEPGAGSDLAGILTKASKHGDRWIVNGAKIWSSGAMHADFGVCITRTDWDVPKHDGITWFAMPLKAPGVKVRPIREINGGWEFCEVFMDDVMLDADEILGEVNKGWSFTHTMLVFERGALRGDRTELPESVAPDLVELARARGSLGDSHVRQLIATAHTHDVVRAALTIRVEKVMRAGGGDGNLASYVKLAKGVFDPLRARIGMEIAGDAAIAFEAGDPGFAASMNYLNCRIHSISGGSNEMQRNGIAERVLGLPREMNVEKGKPFRQVLEDSRKW